MKRDRDGNPIVGNKRWRGRFRWRVNGGRVYEQPNILTNEGFAWLIATSAAFAPPPLIYAALWGFDTTPLATWDAATFAATAGEIGDAPEGYTEAARPLFDYVSVDTADPTHPLFTNYDRNLGFFQPSTFDVRTATQLQVCGLALLTDATKGGAAGTLICASRFLDAPVLFDNRDIVDAIYDITTEALP